MFPRCTLAYLYFWLQQSESVAAVRCQTQQLRLKDPRARRVPAPRLCFFEAPAFRLTTFPPFTVSHGTLSRLCSTSRLRRRSTMAKIYKDTRIDLRPFSPATTVNFQVSAEERPTRRPRFSISSAQEQSDIPIAKDEEEFARRYLATQGAVYFRKRKTYPRTFVWRVVNDNKTLEIQCADLTKSGTEHHEHDITLRLHFTDQILPAGVALADSEEHEVLSVFVITESKQLHTLSLRSEFFRRSESIDDNVSEWCKTCTPAPLSFANPHRLHASTPQELFIALDSGALLRLTRRAGDDGKRICSSFYPCSIF